jgi:HTH-type transcriptional regulator/antitoxin HigA
MITEIKNKKDYHSVMAEMETYLQKGFSKLTKKESKELERLSKLVEAYENVYYSLPMKPERLGDMIALKMFERKMKQKDLARLLEISPTRVSEVLHGKRRITIDLAKKLHEKLDIEAEFILKCA